MSLMRIDPDRWRRLEPLLRQALELPAPERAAFVARACPEDPGLQAELRRLVDADGDAAGFLERPAHLDALDPDDAAAPAGGAPGAAGMSIGPYRVVREIGRGGMGVVYEAEQTRPRRRVALKVILGGRHVDAHAVRLFEREAASLARLKHPSIAAIHESGCTPEGEHFFVMELVEGVPLSDLLRERGAARSRPEVRRRLELFRRIASAVAYAHNRGVIHLDLKPANILVLDPSADVPHVKVLDFGLARITDPDAESTTVQTAAGRIQGTLGYMSPEQIRGRRDEVDARTDVYALGVILHRLLAGGLPYDLDRTDLTEMARRICDMPPRSLRETAGGGAKFDRDLVIIVGKALEKRPADRYATVAAMEEDVARYLDNLPILARPPSAGYQARRLVARHKTLFGAAGLLVLSLGVLAAVSTLQARRIAAERDRANLEARTAARVSEFLVGLFAAPDPYAGSGKEVTAAAIVAAGSKRIHEELAGEPRVKARLLGTLAAVQWNLGRRDEAIPMQEEALALSRRLYGERHVETMRAMGDLARDYALSGRMADADALYTLLVALRREQQGPDSPELLSALSGLAWLRYNQGNYAEAARLRREVYEARRRVLGADDRATLQAGAELGEGERLSRRYAEAEALYRDTIDRQRRVLGPDHPETLGAATGLASVYDDQKRYREAEEVLTETTATMRRVLGEDHPTTISAMNDLTVVLDHAGRTPDALDLARRVLAAEQRTVGPDHPWTLGTSTNVAVYESRLGRHAEADAHLRDALARQSRVLGASHPWALETRYHLAVNAARRGNGKEALRWLAEAVTNGYADPDALASDESLERLRPDPAFASIVEKARDNAAAAARP